MQLDPQSSFAQANLGLLLLQDGNFNEAITRVKDALAINPDVPRGK